MKFRSLALLVATGAMLLAACGADKEQKVLSGLRSDPPMSVAALTPLPDASAADAGFTFKAQPGKFLIVYFGYTQCPDVCPTTLSEVKKAFAKAGDGIASKVDVAMITIDPDRDSGELLTNYVQSFIGGAHALRTADQDLLQKTAKGFGTTYSVTKNAKGETEVVHGGNLYVVDPEGTIVLTWPFGLKSAAIATDLEILFAKG